jgi:hypothetical protein
MSNKLPRLPRRYGRPAVPSQSPDPSVERLTGVAIMRNGNVISSDEHRSHWRLRDVMGDENPSHQPFGDVCGFRTNLREFVTRAEAADVGRASGQVRSRTHELLSSDVDW